MVPLGVKRDGVLEMHVMEFKDNITYDIGNANLSVLSLDTLIANLRSNYRFDKIIIVRDFQKAVKKTFPRIELDIRFENVKVKLYCEIPKICCEKYIRSLKPIQQKKRFMDWVWKFYCGCV